ncbi:MAG TPA: SRPBCC family protein [Candidatus Limnocylindrales bacterium]|jgi:uncharacterized membrane protein|nr:SRPBCC family protein [Candidatus Limnocylindrales bacterium]
MSHISESIDVDVPVKVAYDQWTQFESFPQFMDGVDRVAQVDDTTLDWTATIAGKTKHWRARITEQQPDELVAWRSIDGARNDGSVSFDSLGTNSTRVSLDLDVEPDGAIESVGDALGIVEGRVRGDLERFKEFIEGRQVATGAWRGEVEGGTKVSDADSGPGSSTGSGRFTSYDEVRQGGGTE